MEIKLRKFRYENVRDFKKLEVNLNVKEERDMSNICLMQMPNGTGKTTSMGLLRAVISGKRFSYEETMGFKPTAFKADVGSFEAVLDFNKETYTLGVELDYDTGSSKFYTTRSQIMGGGKESGHNPPTEASYFTSYDFVKLFIFDGEFCSDILDRHQMAAENAISIMYGLDRLRLLQQDIAKDASDRLLANPDRTTNVNTRIGLTGLQNKWTRVNNKLTELETHQKTLAGELETLQAEYDRNLKTIKDAPHSDADFKEKEKALQIEIDTAKNVIKANIEDIFSSIRRPHNFSEEMNSRIKKLSEGLIELKLPKTTSSEFFKELANKAEECICGTKLDAEKRQNILDNTKKYLSEDNISILNAVKSFIRDIREHKNIGDFVAKIEPLRTEYHTALQKKEILMLKVNPDKKNEIEGLYKRNEELTSLMDPIKGKLLILEATDTRDLTDLSCTWENNINKCLHEKAELKSKISEAQGNLQFSQKADLLKVMAEKIFANAVEKIKKEILAETNETIASILNYGSIRIEKIEKCIKLENRDAGSEGQNLVVAYSFLTTLFSKCNHSFPFVVDSPAGKLDLQVRREVAGRIPKLFDQLLIFITSGERPGFLDGIEKYKNIQYLTIHKNLDAPGEVHLSTDKAYFKKFHSEDEEE
jgi:DNA sulfur modification protein DndD